MYQEKITELEKEIQRCQEYILTKEERIRELEGEISELKEMGTKEDITMNDKIQLLREKIESKELFIRNNDESIAELNRLNKIHRTDIEKLEKEIEDLMNQVFNFDKFEAGKQTVAVKTQHDLEIFLAYLTGKNLTWRDSRKPLKYIPIFRDEVINIKIISNGIAYYEGYSTINNVILFSKEMLC